MAHTTNMMIHDRLTPVVQTDVSAQEIDDAVEKIQNMTPATIHALANMGANTYSTVLQGVLAMEPTGGTFFAVADSALINASDAAFPGSETQYFVMADLITDSSTRRSVLAVNFATGTVKTRIASGSAWKTSWSAELVGKDYAVFKGGDTLWGNLYIAKEGPVFGLYNSDKRRVTLVENGDSGHGVIAALSNSAWDTPWYDRSAVFLYPETADLAGMLSLVTAKDNAYSEYKILHSGNVSNFVQPIQMVSYVGTGTYGESNPTSVTFEFAPKLVLLFERSGENCNTATHTHQHMAELTTEYKAYGNTLLDRGGGSIGGDAYIKKSADGKTLTWYATHPESGAFYQFNRSGTQYSAIAFA